MGNQHTKGQTKSLVEYSEMQFYKQERKVSDLDFADDIALLENDMFGSQKQLEKYSTNAEKVGLITHEEKTVFITRNNESDIKLTLSGRELKRVDDFKYLGSYVGSTEKDIEARIGLAWSAFDKLREVLTSPKLPIKLRTEIFNASCVSVLLYGCESWTLTEELSSKVDIFTRTIYRIMLGVSQSETHMTNKDLYNTVNQQPTSLHCSIGQCIQNYTHL